MTSTDWIGKDVIAADGERLGRVKEVQGGYFAVDAPLARHFWLSAIYVATLSRFDELRLTLSSREIEDHKLDKPGLEPAQDSDAARAADSLLSDEQALAQRERMERDLLGQGRQRR